MFDLIPRFLLVHIPILFGSVSPVTTVKEPRETPNTVIKGIPKERPLQIDYG